jgi:hypothetical protein
MGYIFAAIVIMDVLFTGLIVKYVPCKSILMISIDKQRFTLPFIL